MLQEAHGNDNGSPFAVEESAQKVGEVYHNETGTASGSPGLRPAITSRGSRAARHTPDMPRPYQVPSSLRTSFDNSSTHPLLPCLDELTPKRTDPEEPGSTRRPN